MAVRIVGLSGNDLELVNGLCLHPADPAKMPGVGSTKHRPYSRPNEALLVVVNQAGNLPDLLKTGLDVLMSPGHN